MSMQGYIHIDSYAILEKISYEPARLDLHYIFPIKVLR